MTRDRWNEVYMKKGEEIGAEGETLLVALDGERTYALSPAAYLVWSLCDGKTSVGDIVERIMQSLEGDVDEEWIYQAVITIIDRLAEVDLIEKIGSRNEPL